MKSAGLLVSVGLCFFLSCAWAFLAVGVARAAAGRAWVGGPAAAAASPSLRRRSAWSAPLAARVRAPVASRARLSDEEGDEEGEESEEGEPETPNPLVEESDAVSPFKEGIAFPTSLNGSDVRVGIISARWNADIISGLYKGVNESLIGAFAFAFASCARSSSSPSPLPSAQRPQLTTPNPHPHPHSHPSLRRQAQQHLQHLRARGLRAASDGTPARHVQAR